MKDEKKTTTSKTKKAAPEAVAVHLADPTPGKDRESKEAASALVQALLASGKKAHDENEIKEGLEKVIGVFVDLDTGENAPILKGGARILSPKEDEIEKDVDEDEDLMDETDPYDRLEEATRELTPLETLRDMATTDVEILNGDQLPELQRIIVRLAADVTTPWQLSNGAKDYLEALLNLREKAESLLAKMDVLMPPEGKNGK